MDPISILELVGGVLRTTGEVSKLIYLFIHEAKRVDDTLTGFADEINGLKRVLLAISTTLNDPQLRLAEISPGQYGNKDMWEAIHGSLADCHTYLEKLSTELANISRKKGQGGLFRQAWRTFELRLSKDDIAGIRSHVHSHHISLNTMLQMLSVYVTCRLPMQMQSGLAVQIDTLGGMLSKMQAMIDQQPSTPQALVPPEEIVVEQFWNDEQGSRKKLKEVGEKVRSNASLISAARSTVWGGSERNSVYSTTGSELGEQLSYAAQHNIETWLTQPKLAAITESDSSSEGSTSAPNESIFSKQSGSAPTTNTKISEIEELDSDGEGRLEFEILQKLLAKGKRLYDNGKYPEAETTLRRSLKRSTSLSPSLRSLLDLKSPKLLLARSCFSQQKFDEAQSLLVGLTQELAIDDSHAALILDASFSLSEVFLHKQDFGNAEIYCKRTIVGRGRVNGKIHESYHDAIRLLTRIYISKGDEDEADAWSEMLPKTIPEVTVDMTGTEDETDLSNEGSMANLSSQIPSRPYLAKGISSPSLNTGEFLTRPTTPGRKRFPINISGTSRLENSSLENLDVANHHRTLSQPMLPNNDDTLPTRTSVHHLTKTRSWSGQSEILQQQADLLSLLDRRVTSLNGFEVSTGLRKMASIDMDFLVDLSNKSGDAAIMRSPKARRILQRSEDHRNPQFLSELFEENPASDLMVVKDPLYVGPITEDSGYCTHLLIEAGFDLRTPSEFNPEKTLLWAATQGHDILVRCLIAGLHIQLSPDKLIFFVKASTLDFIEPSTDDTPLLKAARNGHERCLRILLDHGANISHVSRTSQTALILASARGFTECVTTLLLFPGVNVHAQDIEGSTALILAASAGYVNVVSMLLNAGSDVNIRNSSGKTALARATRRGHARVVALLAMTKGIVDLPDVRGETAMGWAEKSLGNGEMFAILQKLHARRNEDLISTN